MNNLSSLNNLSGLGTKGKSSSFSPSSIAGLILWLDAKKKVYSSGTTPATDGQGVGVWGDNSVTANDATASAKPTYRATGGPNSNPCIEFDGSTNIMNIATTPITVTTSTIFVVYNKTAVTGDYAALFTAARIDFLSELDAVGGDVWGSYMGTNVSSGVQVTNTFKVYSMVTRNFNDVDLVTNGSVVNRTTGIAFTTFAPSATISHIGASQAGPITQPVACKICELLIYNTPLSSANRSAVEHYLGTKWGITVA